MLGKNQIVLDYQTWLRGMSSGSEISDGGFSDETESINLSVEPGVVYPPAAQVDGDSDVILDDEIIASCPDAQGASPNDRLVMTDDGDFMRYNGTKLVDVAGGADATRTYTKGTSDMVAWNGRVYFTSQEFLGEWQTATDTFNFTFFQFANSAAHPPHELIVFEKNLYITDGNVLYRMTEVGGSIQAVMTLETNEYITALGIDPGDGKMVVATTYGQNYSSTINKINKVLWYDGYSDKPYRVIQVQDMITAFHNHQGVLFVGYGLNLGALTGVGIQFVRRLTIAGLFGTDLPYKHNFASIGRIMYVIDGSRILAYGPIIAGSPAVWWHFFTNNDNSNIFQCVFNAGNSKLGFSYAGVAAVPKFKTINTISTASSDGLDFFTNWLTFPRPVRIKSMDIFFSSAITSTGNWTFDYYDQSAAGGIASVTSMHGTQTSVLQVRDITGFQAPLWALKLRIGGSSSDTAGIRRIIIHYDPFE